MWNRISKCVLATTLTFFSMSSALLAEAKIQVKVDLEKRLQNQAHKQQVVFVYARAAKGPAMPLAVAKVKVSDLPITVTLDDSMAMAPMFRLSGFNEVIVGARVSKTGDSMPGPGDLQGVSDKIMLNQQSAAVPVTIDQIIP